MLNQRHIHILEERGLDPEILVRYGVESCPERGNNWVKIPYLEAGRVINHKFRTIEGEKQFNQEAGAKKIFWNRDVLTDETLASQRLIITEGEFDALAAIQAGFSRTISVPDGAPAQEIGDKETAKYTFLDDCPNLDSVKEIILATDGDGPGTNLMNDLAHRLGRARCKWVRYPKGCKDLNDALKRYGARGVVETINRAQWVKVPGVARMSELPPLKEQPTYDVGIPDLHDHFRLRPGDLSVVIGVPGHGKTALLNAIAGHMAMAYGWVIASASFEQRAQIDYRRNLRTFHAGKLARDMDEAEIVAADRWIDEQFALLVPDVEDEVTLEWMLERIEAAIVRYDAKLVLIDPVNEMDHVRPADMSETDYLGFMLKTFKRLAFRFQVHVMLAAHPQKLQRNKDGKYPIPTLYDGAGTAHYYNKPDVGIIINKMDAEKTLIRVQKTKYHDVLGKPGDVTVKFNISTGRYERIEDAATRNWTEKD